VKHRNQQTAATNQSRVSTVSSHKKKQQQKQEVSTMKKKLAVLLAVASIASASSAMAATVYNSQGKLFPTGNTLPQAYKVAYEVYNATAGATTIASLGQMNILLAQPLTTGQNVNVVITQNALFNSAGTGQNRYGLCLLTSDALGTLPYNLANLTANDPSFCAAGNIVAAMPPSGVTTGNLGMQVTGGGAANLGLDVAAGQVIQLVQWNDNAATGGIAAPADPLYDNNQMDSALGVDETPSLIRGASLFVSPGLAADCTTNPLIKMTFSSAGGESTAVPFNFAYITPQFGFTGPTGSALDAELNTDVDFAQFVFPTSAPNVTSTTNITVNPFYTIADNAAAAPLYWISKAATSPSGTTTFKLNSAAVEPSLDVFDLDGAAGACVRDTNGQLWTCTEAAAPLVGAHFVTADLGGQENNPTNWTISDFAINVTTAGYSALCFAAPGPSVGSWYGGIEAIVPFVKSTDTYKTYIKLYNRYDSAAHTPAKVYVANMNQTTKSIITSIVQLGQGEYSLNSGIPTGGFITVTGKDLLDGGILTAQELSDGAPIKFLIRVPAQAGSTNGGYTTLEGNFDDSGVAALGTGGTVLGSASGVATASAVDPYITGIVVQTYNGGTAQRPIPLVFKSFKQGQYN
jgi:hypothetical protein